MNTRPVPENRAGPLPTFRLRAPSGTYIPLHFFPDERKAELACVCVDSKYENQGIGGKLMQFTENQARSLGAAELFCLSTQTFNYFVQKGGFRQGMIDDLPVERRERYEKSGRRSQILIKRLL